MGRGMQSSGRARVWGLRPPGWPGWVSLRAEGQRNAQKGWRTEDTHSLFPSLALGGPRWPYRGRKPQLCQDTGRAHYLGCGVSHSPQAAFTVRTELRLPGKVCWEKENLKPSFCGQIPRILNGKSSAPAEGVLKGREGIGRGRNRGREGKIY